MASSISFSFFFLLSLFFTQIYARDVQFFSKVSPTTTTGIIPAKDETFNKQEQDPSFMQETQNAYGLYGQEQESTQSQFPTTTKLAGKTPTSETPTTTYTPYKSQTQEGYTNYPNSNSNNNYYSNEQFSDNAYGEQQQNSGESNYAADLGNQNYKKNNYYGYNNGNKNVERQGMSDTRFMENGKYYYPNQNNYYPTQNQNRNQNQNSRSNYDSRAYNTNNNENTYEFDNSMENFQNQNQGEFQENDQYVP
ncbi:protein E6 [Euphorbia lathyris]|uniref:protein E6 n=1 Tax=Euphorbia lathyris TaxID=212925 RepID=UPI00331405C1